MSKVNRIEESRRALDAALGEFDRATGAKDLLTAARSVRAATDALEQATVLEARHDGTSWSKIGAIYGLTKQGAQQRFRERGGADAPTPPDQID